MNHHRRPELSRNQILDAAEELFSQKGYAGASMSQIARLSGKSQALIHHHFKNKKGLWSAVKERFGAHFAELLYPLLEKESLSESFIQSWPAKYLSFWKTHPRLRRIILWQQLENDDSPWQTMDEMFSIAVRKIMEGQQSGKIRCGIHPGHIISILTGALMFWLNNKEPYCKRLGLDVSDERVDDCFVNDLEKILLKGLLAMS